MNTGFILSMSIAFSVIIGIVRWKVIDPSYYPFIYNIIIVMLVEIINACHTYSTGTIKTLNTFSLIDFILFAWLFHNWGLFNHNKKRFFIIIGLFVAAWICITFFITGFSNINAKFWICMGIIIFYSFFTLTRATDLSGGMLHLSKSFKSNLQNIVNYSNLFVNLLYAVAVIWVPRKKNITTLL